jgi:hypothetical protein
MRPHTSRVGRAVLALIPTALVLSASAFANDKVGVATCDDVITKYEACLTRMPPAQQSQIKASVVQMRTGWKSMASNAEAKPNLDSMCRNMGDSLKIAVSQYSCQW